MKSIKTFGSYEPKTRQGFVTEVVTMDALKDSGVAFQGNAIQINDEITFPGTREDVRLHRTNVVKDQTGKEAVHMISIEVAKNGKITTLPIASVRRTGRNFEGSCAFTQEMADQTKFENDEARIDFLLGKTIVCTAMREMETQKFENRRPVDGVFVKRNFPVLEIANPVKNAALFA